MSVSIPESMMDEQARFRRFLKAEVAPAIPSWHRSGRIDNDFFRKMGRGGWYGFVARDGRLEKQAALREALLAETLASVSPGVAISALAHIDLGLMGLYLFGSESLVARHGPAAVSGEKILCLGNTENIAGSDVAGIRMAAEKVSGGWCLSGTKAFVTNGAIADLAVITALTR